MSSAAAPSSYLGPILDAVKQAADAAFNGVEKQLPALTGEALTAFNTIVLPRLDVPSFLVPLITGAESKVSVALDNLALTELDLLNKRVDQLL
jgi:hypothetical protein